MIANRKRLLIAVTLLALALVAAIAMRARRQSTPTGPASTASALDNTPSDAETPAIQASERELVEPGQPVFAPATGTPIRGLALDLAGAPLSGVTIEQRINTRRTLVAYSSADGSFETRLARFEGVLTTGDGPWECVAPCRLDRARAEESHVLVVARAVALRGRVVDERGRGVCEAAVGVRVPVDAKQALPASFSVAPDILGAATSDATGWFQIQRLAFVPGGRLLASRDPLEPVGQAFEPSDEPLVIVLGDPEHERLIEVLVSDTQQQPLDGATIEFGHYHGRTTADGMYRFTLRERDPQPPSAETPLIACMSGHQPGLIEGFGAVAIDGTRAPILRSIALAAPDLSIRGRVVDALGNPCRVTSVRIASHADVLRGPSSCANGGERHVAGIDAFELHGLRQGDYVLECTVQQPLASFLSESIRAGASDVVLRVPPDLVAPRVVGRVYSRAGSVVPNARVGVDLGELANLAITHPKPYFDRLLEQSTCDESGLFELIDVPRSRAHLVVWHPSIATTVLDVDELDLTRDLRIVVRGMAKLQVVGLPERLGQLRLHLSGAPGEQPPLNAPWRGVAGDTCMLKLREGFSDTIEVAEGRYTLSADNPAGVLDAREIELIAGQTLVVRP